MNLDQFQLGLLVAFTATLLLPLLILAVGFIWWTKHTHGAVEWKPKHVSITLEDRSADAPRDPAAG